MRPNTTTCRSARCVVHEGEVLAAARNERELRGDPTAHAEVLALREASPRLGTWRLPTPSCM